MRKDQAGGAMIQLPEVAVHRPIEKGGERPYIWLKRKVRASTPPGDMGEYIRGSTNTADPYDDAAFLVEAFVDDPSTWPALADSEEWYIVSNILTTAEILELTEESSADIIGVGII